ncbi:MAG: response regulator [Candidatus Zixiibacteriota bacterium]|nr:MAG: response regulator [candidate division Zixibacteria bacterium]
MSKRFEVLVVDDEPIVGKRLKVALEKTGYDVEVFDSGPAALERIGEKQFDFVVTDVRMDNVDGIDILNKVTETSPRTKVIIITGYATIELAREALVKGAYDFIAKPFQPDDLREVLERAVKARELDSDK